MFRNDPLESLKVSSTFDAIPFVRDYLQKEIEGQLRTLLMDEVPVIIHRLSQRLWVPEFREREDQELSQKLDDSSTIEKPVDPLASPPQDPVDGSGNVLDANQIASLSLDSGTETQALFSQKNLLRLGALTDSHRTLSLFTPGIRDAVFRAWAGPTERGERYGTNGRATPALSRSHSYTGHVGTTYTFNESSEATQRATRPTLSSFGSAASGLGMAPSKHGKAPGGRKRKHRVVNLRKKAVHGDDVESLSGESSTASGTMSSAASEYGARPRTPERQDDELVTPPRTPEKPQVQKEPGDGTPLRLRNLALDTMPIDPDITPRASMYDTSTSSKHPRPEPSAVRPQLRSSQCLQPPQYPAAKMAEKTDTSIPQVFQHVSPTPYIETASSGGILEKAWMAKMAGEIARKAQEHRGADSSFWTRHEKEETPPPAYGA